MRFIPEKDITKYHCFYPLDCSFLNKNTLECNKSCVREIINDRERMLAEIINFIGDWENKSHQNTSECYIDKGAIIAKIESYKWDK